MKILLIDKDRKWLCDLRRVLETYYLVDFVSNGSDGCSLAAHINYDLIIVGHYPREIAGSEVCQMLRRGNDQTPILVLAGEKEISHKVRCLDSGADDYLTKPFSVEEFLARTRALIRRSSTPITESNMDICGLKIDFTGRQVFKGELELFLRRKEFEILEYLAKNRKRVITRDKLLLQVWPDDTEVSINCIDVHMSRLRRKLGYLGFGSLIKTVRGIGYKIDV